VVFLLEKPENISSLQPTKYAYLLILSVTDEGYSRNMSCTLN